MRSRSYDTITLNDLRHLADLACQDRDAFFTRKARYRDYAGRHIATALCQGAALHYLDGRNGVKDWDVWSFFAEIPGNPFPYRRVKAVPFGRPGFIGSAGRVDLLGRSLRCGSGDDPTTVLRHYLETSTTASARCLAAKAVVLIEPAGRLGEIVWSVGAARAKPAALAADT